MDVRIRETNERAWANASRCRFRCRIGVHQQRLYCKDPAVRFQIRVPQQRRPLHGTGSSATDELGEKVVVSASEPLCLSLLVWACVGEQALAQLCANAIETLHVFKGIMHSIVILLFSRLDTLFSQVLC
mmetsp:Transcript_104821/g.165455  ORF Transcript_104821/g.165455 Transcript_104821/m.165455 type:complete len:129 (+) Transcript_104821:283-669(+)